MQILVGDVHEAVKRSSICGRSAIPWARGPPISLWCTAELTAQLIQNHCWNVVLDTVITFHPYTYYVVHPQTKTSLRSSVGDPSWKQCNDPPLVIAQFSTVDRICHLVSDGNLKHSSCDIFSQLISNQQTGHELPLRLPSDYATSGPGHGIWIVSAWFSSSAVLEKSRVQRNFLDG